VRESCRLRIALEIQGTKHANFFYREITQFTTGAVNLGCQVMTAVYPPYVFQINYLYLFIYLCSHVYVSAVTKSHPWQDCGTLLPKKTFIIQWRM